MPRLNLGPNYQELARHSAIPRQVHPEYKVSPPPSSSTVFENIGYSRMPLPAPTRVPPKTAEFVDRIYGGLIYIVE